MLKITLLRNETLEKEQKHFNNFHHHYQKPLTL